VRALAGSIAASVALHAAAAAWLDPAAYGDRRARQAAPAPLTVALLSPAQPKASMPAAARIGDGGKLAALGSAVYYTAKQVDLKATPLDMKTRVKTQDNFPLGRVATVKLRLYISEQGAIDGYEILAADELPDRALLQDIREIRFRPAERAGRPVKSQKVVQISFIP
jgi:Gram-negative bacterial TonB protein C-terminal